MPIFKIVLWYDILQQYENNKMRLKLGSFAISITLACLCSCHSSSTDVVHDTALRTTADTTAIPGTPGPSGTEPRPGDTTQAHRDSLKRAANISDPSGKAVQKP